MRKHIIMTKPCPVVLFLGCCLFCLLYLTACLFTWMENGVKYKCVDLTLQNWCKVPIKTKGKVLSK